MNDRDEKKDVTRDHQSRGGQHIYAGQVVLGF